MAHIDDERALAHQNEHAELSPSEAPPISRPALEATQHTDQKPSASSGGEILSHDLDQQHHELSNSKPHATISSVSETKHNTGGHNESSVEDGCPIPMTFDMAKSEANDAFVGGDTESTDPSQNGAILWEAIVLDVSVKRPDGAYTSHTLLKYHHRRPIDISAKIQQHVMHASSDKDSVSEGRHWDAPVLLIRHEAQGNIPGVTIKYPSGTKVDTEDGMKEVNQWQQSPDDKVRLFNTQKIPPVAAGHNVSHWDTWLVFKSPHLYQEVRQMVKHYPGILPRLFVRDVSDTWEQEAPYTHGPLLDIFPEIEKRVLSASEAGPSGGSPPTNQQESMNADPDAEFQQDVNIAADHLAILYRHLKPMYESVQADVQKSLAAEKPSFAFGTLWYVLKPGTEVFLKDKWTPWCFAVVDRVFLTRNFTYQGVWCWSIQVWVLSTDGSKIARYRPSPIIINDYPGMKELSSLEVCPTAFWDAKQSRERREIALSRGRILFKALRNGFLVASYAASTARGEPEVMMAFLYQIQANCNSTPAKSSSIIEGDKR